MFFRCMSATSVRNRPAKKPVRKVPSPSGREQWPLTRYYARAAAIVLPHVPMGVYPLILCLTALLNAIHACPAGSRAYPRHVYRPVLLVLWIFQRRSKASPHKEMFRWKRSRLYFRLRKTGLAALRDW